MASASKKLALHRLFDIEPIDMILLQETLGDVDHIYRALLSLKHGWHFHCLYAMGRSRGLAIGYNPRTIKALSAWGGSGFIGMDIFSAELGLNLWIVNIYGPCRQRESFWQHFLNLSIVSLDHVILGGDLNFSIGFGESWGSQAQVDSLSGLLMNLLEQHNLANVPMNNPLPTWRNRRVGEAALARRLDRFLIKESLLN